jgi:Plavaka transposase
LLEVIKGAFQSPDAKRYHWVPFKLFHHSPDGPVYVYSDIYNSNAMLEEDTKIQALLQDPSNDPDSEVAIAPILVWSDSTHLATFDTASLWPIYIFIGNQSKYTQGKPSSYAAHHLAYIPSVSFTLIC